MFSFLPLVREPLRYSTEGKVDNCSDAATCNHLHREMRIPCHFDKWDLLRDNKSEQDEGKSTGYGVALYDGSLIAVAEHSTGISQRNSVRVN